MEMPLAVAVTPMVPPAVERSPFASWETPVFPLVGSLELGGVASLRIGGGELATADRAARRLVEVAPLRESGKRLLMELLDRT